MNYEPASWSTHFTSCQPGARALIDYAAELGIGDDGCYNDRGVRGDTSTPSLHREGRAVDLHDAPALLELVVALVDHYAELGVQQIIWQRQYWRCDRGDVWRPYHGEDPHTSHAHVELTSTAAQSLTVEALRTILEEDDMPTAKEIAEAILDELVTTTYDEGTPQQRDVEVPVRTILGNLALNVDRIRRGQS